jgi:hypothetical protein
MANGPSIPAGSGIGWVDQAARLVTQVGFPVVAAGILLWFILFRFEEGLARVGVQLATTSARAEQFVDLQEVQLGEMKRQTAALEVLAKIAQDLERRELRQAPRPAPPTTQEVPP